jgi:hypothetical protein
MTPDEELFDRVWRWAALRERGLTRHDLASDFWDARSAGYDGGRATPAILSPP